MKQLLLVRHAKSSWKYPELEDFERPLNKRGRKDAPEMARWIAERMAAPELLLVSPATRALCTLTHFMAAWQIDPARQQITPSLYHADPPALWHSITQLPDTVHSALLCGHNPGLEQWLPSATGSDTNLMPTCAVAHITFQATKWRDLTPGSGHLQALYTPRQVLPRYQLESNDKSAR